MTLFVGNLSWQTSGEQLQNLFAGIGPVQSAKVIEDRETGRSRGFGFVDMTIIEDEATAITELHEKNFDGREITVNFSRPRQP